MEYLQRLKSLCHEYSHTIHFMLRPEADLSRAGRELVAEASAFIVCNRLGLYTSDYSISYLKSWISESGDLKKVMPRYSINNQILIMMQKPDATMCQSFTGWKEMGRFVKKGEKGIRVMAPAPYKMEREQDKMGADGKPVLDKDGEPVKEVVEVKVNAFKPVSTFDISQTEGEPVPRDISRKRKIELQFRRV